MKKPHKDIFPKTKKFLTKYYNKVENSKFVKRTLLYWAPLFIPYLVIRLFHFIFRRPDYTHINLLFSLCVMFACIWFLHGPVLVHKYVKEFKSFRNDPKLPDSVKTYFNNNKDKHFTYFLFYRLFEGLLFIAVAIVPIIVSPDILSKNITNGYTDLFFWIIILFLIWFLLYCATSTAFISLISLHIIPDLRKDLILEYCPVTSDHQYAINKLKNFCAKAVRYVCSALYFLPLAFYYLNQQPKLELVRGQAPKFIPPSSNNRIYTIWVVLMLLIYAFFLFFFLTYHNTKIQGYAKGKCKSYLLEEQLKYINEFDSKIDPAKRPIAAAAPRYSAYLRLQEIKLVCKTSPSFDINVVLTYFSAIVAILTSIQGIQTIIAWWTP